MFIEKKVAPSEGLIQHNPYIRLVENATIVNSYIEGNISVDKYSCINRCTIEKYFALSCFSYVSNAQIGRYCTFGSRVSAGAFSHPTNWLSIHEFQYRNTKDIYGDSIYTSDMPTAPTNTNVNIGNDVWIGDNVCIKFGVTIGSGAIIGLGSVVTQNVPPYAIMGGNPARVLRYRFSDEIIRDLLELEWWLLDIQDLANVNFSNIHNAIESVREIKFQKINHS